ncbi:hypothetical protein L6R50_28395, partial [Myxococcota bacterium]|nr:hypothetical protein [Myxococcota bacterium]
MARSEIVFLLGIVALVPGLVGAAPLMRVRAGATERVADGRSATSLLVTAYGPGGAPLPDGATVSLDASLGEVQGDGVIRRGRARFDYVAGTWPGTAVLSAGDGFTLAGDTEIELVPGDPVSTVLHLHGSLSE